MGFKLRMLDKNLYESVVSDLDQVTAGSREALDKVLMACLARLKSEGFLRWNGSSLWLVDVWAERLRSARGKAVGASARGIAPAAIALLCMPMFQFSYLSGQSQSPNLVTLGEDDGGLYGIMMDYDPWIDNLFLDRFSNNLEKYAIDEGMFLMHTSDLNSFLEVVSNLTVPSKSTMSSFVPSLATSARKRLLELMQKVLEHDRCVIAVSD